MEKYSTIRMHDRSSLVIGLKTATIIAATLGVFYQDLVIIANDALQTESMSHILAIPFLFAYLIYRKRKMLRETIPSDDDQAKQSRHLPTIAGIILSTTAILVYWHGSYTFTPLEYHMFSLPIFISGLALVLFNARTVRELAFPIAFLIFLTPPPLEILYVLGSTLSIVSSEISYIIAVVRLGIPAILTSEYGNPTIYITTASGETIPFAVDIACSGIYSMIGFLIFAVFIAYLIRDKPWRKSTLFLTGFSLIYILNITRITAILFIGYHYGGDIALQLFHLLGGWVLIFLGTLILLIISEKVFQTKLFTKPRDKCSACDQNLEESRRSCLACGRIFRPLPVRFKATLMIRTAAIVLLTFLLMSIQAPVFALTEGPAQIIIQTPMGEQGNTQLLPQIKNYTLQFVYRDTDFEERARQDASLLYAYVPSNTTRQPVWVTIEVGSSSSKIHGWEVCLISYRIRRGWPTFVTQLELKDIRIQENPPIIARFFAFQWEKTNQTQVVLYWYEMSRFKTNGPALQQKQVKISLIAYPDTPQEIAETEGKLLPFASAIADHWQPIKAWSQIALLLSQNGAYLATATSALLPPLIILYIFRMRKLRDASAKALQKLSREDQGIVNATHQTKTMPTAMRIAATYEKMNNKTIPTDIIVEKLQKAQETGLIIQKILNVEDEPFIGWKTLL